MARHYDDLPTSTVKTRRQQEDQRRMGFVGQLKAIARHVSSIRSCVTTWMAWITLFGRRSSCPRSTVETLDKLADLRTFGTDERKKGMCYR